MTRSSGKRGVRHPHRKPLLPIYNPSSNAKSETSNWTMKAGGIFALLVFVVVILMGFLGGKDHKTAVVQPIGTPSANGHLEANASGGAEALTKPRDALKSTDAAVDRLKALGILADQRDARKTNSADTRNDASSDDDAGVNTKPLAAGSNLQDAAREGDRHKTSKVQDSGASPRLNTMISKVPRGSPKNDKSAFKPSANPSAKARSKANVGGVTSNKNKLATNPSVIPSNEASEVNVSGDAGTSTVLNEPRDTLERKSAVVNQSEWLSAKERSEAIASGGAKSLINSAEHRDALNADLSLYAPLSTPSSAPSDNKDDAGSDEPVFVPLTDLMNSIGVDQVSTGKEHKPDAVHQTGTRSNDIASGDANALDSLVLANHLVTSKRKSAVVHQRGSPSATEPSNDNISSGDGISANISADKLVARNVIPSREASNVTSSNALSNGHDGLGADDEKYTDNMRILVGNEDFLRDISMCALILTGNNLVEARRWLQGNSDQEPSPDAVRSFLDSKKHKPVENFAAALDLLTQYAAANDGPVVVELSEDDSDDDVITGSFGSVTPGSLPEDFVDVGHSGGDGGVPDPEREANVDLNSEDHRDDELKEIELTPTPGPSDVDELKQRFPGYNEGRYNAALTKSRGDLNEAVKLLSSIQVPTRTATQDRLKHIWDSFSRKNGRSIVHRLIYAPGWQPGEKLGLFDWRIIPKPDVTALHIRCIRHKNLVYEETEYEYLLPVLSAVHSDDDVLALSPDGRDRFKKEHLEKFECNQPLTPHISTVNTVPLQTSGPNTDSPLSSNVSGAKGLDTSHDSNQTSNVSTDASPNPSVSGANGVLSSPNSNQTSNVSTAPMVIAKRLDHTIDPPNWNCRKNNGGCGRRNSAKSSSCLRCAKKRGAADFVQVNALFKATGGCEVFFQNQASDTGVCP
eukprot:102087_1